VTPAGTVVGAGSETGVGVGVGVLTVDDDLVGSSPVGAVTARSHATPKLQKKRSPISLLGGVIAVRWGKDQANG
jgi:hypothetical protein